LSEAVAVKQFLIDFSVVFLGIILVGLIFDSSDFESHELIRAKAFDLNLTGVFLAIII
jgi:hypothetical protein